MKKIYLIIFCLVLSSCSGAKPKITYDLNGRWSGKTGDERSVYVVIENNGFRVINILFDLPNCPLRGYIIYYHEPQYAIEGNTFSLETQYLSIKGTFDDENSVSANFKISQGFCDGNISTTLTAIKDGPSSIPPSGQSIPEPVKMPESKISSQLFKPDSGTNGFGRSPIEPYSKGDWDLTRFLTTEAYIPIPRGWTAVATQDQMEILANENDVYVILGALSSSSFNNKSVEEVISEGVSITKSKVALERIIDAQKGYFLGTREVVSGEQEIILMVISKDTKGIFNYFWITVPKKKWKSYFPIMQDMIQYWSLTDGTPMGISLPDSLADQ